MADATETTTTATPAGAEAVSPATGAAIPALAPRDDFPILARTVHDGQPLIYLDSAASAQKPHQVLDAMDRFARTSYANIHRGVHTLSEEATAAYEGARKKVARFINARSVREIIWTRNTTEAINLVARSW
ncbi:MAG TPA: aminotransferase class V-fold PLP-dependent enzyme, partial [Ktedonobacterales bacterium]